MKQIKIILFAFGCSLLLSGTKAFAQVERLPDEASYPVLQELAGVETPAVLLSGTWQFRYSPDSKWDKIQVPGEPAMQDIGVIWKKGKYQNTTTEKVIKFIENF